MTLATCCSSRLATLSRAAAKSAAARLRRMGVLPTRVDWAYRAAICERCPLRVIHKGQSHCGRPLLEQIHRDPTIDGCGCPTHAKAKDPTQHCPLTPRHHPAHQTETGCDCKWCRL